MNKVRVRFAPSPTGYLHVGGLRTALYDFLFAKKNGGEFILKIEDTDRKRYVEGATESLIRSLDWAGLAWSEGVFLDKEGLVVESGQYGSYIQSKKIDVYKKFAEQLIDEKKAYYCFCTPERLDELRQIQTANKQAPMYDRHCADLTPEEVRKNLESSVPYVVRMKIEKNRTLTTDDIIRGQVKFNTNVIDDQVILKSDGFPTYHLASIIDDHDMHISHVIRGEEWLPSLPKHILLYEYFGWEPPQFAHLPLLVNQDRSKLSKRQGDVAVEDYVAKGYLKEAIINFVALLGWNPGEGSVQEIFSMDELIEKFELTKVHKAGAVFDIKKLDWINSQYIKKMSADELYKNALPFFEKKEFFTNASDDKKTEQYLKKILAIEKERLAKFSDVGEENRFFFQDTACEKEMLRWKKITDEEIKRSLETSRGVLEKISDNQWTKETLESNLLEAAGDKRGDLLWPLRVALTGAQKSPSPFEVAWVLGKIETIKRISQASELF